MNPSIENRCACIALLIACSAFAQAAPLEGQRGEAAGTVWQSSWLDLNKVTAFKRGERLKLRLQGAAENVVVRLLDADSDPSESTGIEGGVHKVPGNGVLELKLQRDHPKVTQISVHADKEAWGRPLGERNGRITLLGVERLSP
jgi:hypothetical protein